MTEIWQWESTVRKNGISQQGIFSKLGETGRTRQQSWSTTNEVQTLEVQNMIKQANQSKRVFSQDFRYVAIAT